MTDCNHEWVQMNEKDLDMDPPKVHIKCHLCNSETYELESKWARQQTIPRLVDRVKKLENAVINIVEILEQIKNHSTEKPTEPAKKTTKKEGK